MSRALWCVSKGVAAAPVAFHTDKVAVVDKLPSGPAVFFVGRALAVVFDEGKLSLFTIDLQPPHPIGKMDKVASRRRGQSAGNADLPKTFEPLVQGVLY